MLYDNPTLLTTKEQYFFEDIYEKCGVEPFGALQSFGGVNSRLNYYGGNTYGGQVLDPQRWTLTYDGIERHAIALGPKLQDPNFDFGEIDAKEMAYGTCVDISVVLDSVTYYIPAIIVDVKAHSAPIGMIQTGESFAGEKVDTGKSGLIVEWYVINEDAKGNKKSKGLNRFNRNGSIIIYREELLE